MNITKKDWFCYKCSLQFDSQHVYSLHLKLLHKNKIAKKSIINELKSIETLASKEKSDSSNQILSEKNEKKNFKCEVCQYSSSQKSSL